MALDSAESTLRLLASACRLIPGHALVLDYIRRSYRNDPYRVVLELLLFFYAMKYIFSRKYSKRAQYEKELSTQDIEELIEDWEPEKIVPEPKSDVQKSSSFVFYGKHGIHIKNIEEKGLLNCSSFDFLGFSEDSEIPALAKKTLREYGVGTCGPRGFYGTLDVHLRLEDAIAKFIGTEAAIIYSQSFSAVSSTIPAFAKRDDIIVADERVNLAIRTGIEVSRSRAYFFKHNDMEDLDKILAKIDNDEKKKPLRKRFLISEAIFSDDCSLAPLSELVRLKKKYFYRLLMDESLSIGVLGDSGRGSFEHAGLCPKDIDIIVGSMSHAFGSGGGFCAGTVQIVDHQRLSSQAYCFSASLPAIFARTSLHVLERLEESSFAGVRKLSKNISAFNSLLKKNYSKLLMEGDAACPMRMVCFTGNTHEDRIKLQSKFISDASKAGLLFSAVKFLPSTLEANNQQSCDTQSPQAKVRCSISAAMSTKELESIAMFINKF